MTSKALALGAAAALLLTGAAIAQAPATDPDRPSTPGKMRPNPSAQVIGGSARNGNAAVSEPTAATMGEATDAAARTSIDARRRACVVNPPEPNTKAWKKCQEVGAEPPR